MADTEKKPNFYFPYNNSLGSIESPLITLQDVGFEFEKNKKILEHVDFPIYKNSKIGIIGCNGTGKSVLLKLIDDSEVRTCLWMHLEKR